MSSDTVVQNGLPKKWRFFLLALFIILPLTIRRQFDSDIWFLLNGGRYVLENGIPYTEPFTIHAGFAFVMQQWLSCVIFWLGYSRLGTLGLTLIMYVVSLLTVFVLFKLCMLVSERNFIVSYGVTFLTAALILIFMVTRPQIFSLLILLAELYFLERYAVSGRAVWLLALPVLSVLLVNMHASMWLMLFVLALPYIVDSFNIKIGAVRGERRKRLPLLAALAVSVLTGLINPYGFSAETYLFRSYGSEAVNSTVIEMLPPDINTLTGKLIFGIILLVFILYAANMKNAPRLRYVLLTLGTAYMAVSSRRSFQLFLIASAFGIAYLLRGGARREIKMDSGGSGKLRRVLCILVCAALIGALCLSFTVSDSWDDPKSKNAVDFLLGQSSAEDIVLYTGYNDGAYAEYRGIRSYMDARAEVFFEKNNGSFEVMDEYIELQKGVAYYADVLDKYGFTHLLASKIDILWEYLAHDPDYALIYEDDYCRLFERV